MDRDLIILLGVFVLLVVFFLVASAPRSPTTPNPPEINDTLQQTTPEMNAPETEEPTTFYDPRVEEACSLYYRDLHVLKPTTSPLYDCILSCEGNLLGWCPEEEYFYVCLKELITDYPDEARTLYRSVKSFYRSIRLGNTPDLNSPIGTTTSHYYLSLTDLYPYLQRFINEKNTLLICEGMRKALRKA